jgi:hypothetical protein
MENIKIPETVWSAIQRIEKEEPRMAFELTKNIIEYQKGNDSQLDSQGILGALFILSIHIINSTNTQDGK